MPHKKRILIFPFNLLSHYLRCIIFANTYYKEEEYDVLFLSSINYNNFVEQHGYATFTCEQFDANIVMALSEKFDFSWLNNNAIEKVFLAQVEVIKQLQPVMVIGDVAPSLKMAAELTNVKYVALTNGYLTNYYAHTRKLTRTHKAYQYIQQLPEKYADKLTRFAEKIAFKTVHKPFKALRKKYHLKKISNYLLEMEGDQNLIPDAPLLFPQKELPGNYKFIAPLIYLYEEDEKHWLNKLDSTKPILCICMGSTGNWNKLSFFNNSYYSQYTIITAGDYGRALNASHIVARNFVNLDQVLNKAHLLICHGGNGTIYYGLRKGIYMLCLTSHFEQEWNVHALERIGSGKSANAFTTADWQKHIALALKIKLRPFL